MKNLVYKLVPTMKQTLLLFIGFCIFCLTSCETSKEPQKKVETTRIMVKPIVQVGTIGKVTLTNKMWDITIDDYNLINEGDTLTLTHYIDSEYDTKPLQIEGMCIVQRMYDNKPVAVN